MNRNPTLDDLKNRCLVPNDLRWLQEDFPIAVAHADGRMPSVLLKKRLIHQENYDEDGVLHDVANAVEYWLDGECVHRSVDVDVKRMPEGTKTLVGMMG